jgi:citrate/tricarballylate utilization protein
MPHDISLLAEAQRQFLICSACRYCEGYCATFPAIEGRTEYSAADVGYIANLCHDCRACAQACMYDAPHEFAVNIPKLLGAVRIETYRPRFGGGTTLGIAALVLAALLAAIGASGRWGAFTTPQLGPGAFYAVVPSAWMVIPALLLGLYGLVVLMSAARNLVRENGARGTLRDWFGAFHDGLALVYLRGAGGGCYYPEQHHPSSARRALHVTLVAGVALAFAATVAAAVMQDLLGMLPPYPVLSVPVVLGILGGIGIVAGGGGLLTMKFHPVARRGAADGMTSLDVAFLVALLVVAITGLLLLALRDSAAMGTLLAIHLAAVAALFITAPYGKFLHVPLRLAALYIFRIEERQR